MLLMPKVCIRSSRHRPNRGTDENCLAESADLNAIAYDVFAQAEHDERLRTYVSENEKVLNQLNTIIQEETSVC